MSAEPDEATIAEWCRRSRAAQGLPERIDDGAVLAKVATLALVSAPEHDGKGDGP